MNITKYKIWLYFNKTFKVINISIFSFDSSLHGAMHKSPLQNAENGIKKLYIKKLM